jgi:hypothetical protein
MLDRTKEYIKSGITVNIPKKNILNPIKISYEESYPKSYFGNIYHMIATIVEIQDTYRINDNLEYFVKYDNINKKYDTDYDFSYRNLFKSTFNPEKSGSSMTNWTNVFNTNDINLNIISPLLKKHNDMSIRFPCVISTPVIHMIYILSYIYDSVILEKKDLWLNDNFTVKCRTLRKDNYSVIKSQLKSIIFTEKTRQYKIDKLFDNFEVDENFKMMIIKFINIVGPCISDIWLNAISNIKSSPSDRKPKIWNEYDLLLGIIH